MRLLCLGSWVGSAYMVYKYLFQSIGVFYELFVYIFTKKYIDIFIYIIYPVYIRQALLSLRLVGVVC